MPLRPAQSTGLFSPFSVIIWYCLNRYYDGIIAFGSDFNGRHYLLFSAEAGILESDYG